VGGAYRDENQAAFAAVSSLREENAALRAELASVQERLSVLERGNLPLPSPPRSVQRRLVDSMIGGIGLAVMAAIALFAARGPQCSRVAATRSVEKRVTESAPPLPAAESDLGPSVPAPTTRYHYEPIDDPLGPPFDRGAVAAALATVDLSGCDSAGGPTGSGHVRVTFDPSGIVAATEVDQPPFMGTAVGACIASKYHATRVPVFSGHPVTVGKSFVLDPLPLRLGF
jgi:hypothetical protein